MIAAAGRGRSCRLPLLCCFLALLLSLSLSLAGALSAFVLSPSAPLGHVLPGRRLPALVWTTC